MVTQDKETKKWQFRTKYYNEKKLSIEYRVFDGYGTKAEAAKALRMQEETFSAAMAHRKQSYVKTPLLSELLEEWFHEIIVPYYSAAYKTVVHWTIQALLSTTQEDRDISRITESWARALIFATEAVSPSCPLESKNVLNGAFEYAKLKKYVTKNPVADIPVKRKKVKRDIYYSREQLRLLVREARKTSVYLEVLLGLLMGLRRGEILGLKFRDVDFDRGTIFIRRQLTNESPTVYEGCQKMGKQKHVLVEKPPKSPNSLRLLKAPDLVMEELMRRQEKNRKIWGVFFGGALPENDYVSINRKGDHLADGTLGVSLQRICQRCGLPPIPFRMLRKSFATLHIEAGAPLNDVAAYLGHQPSTCYEFYVGSTSDEYGKLVSVVAQADPFLAAERWA